MKKKVVKSKKVTIETLDSKIEKLSNTIESLSISTAKGFNSVDIQLSSMKEKMEDIDQNIKSTRRDIANMGDKFVSYHTFDQLAERVNKLEKNKK